MLYPLCIRLFVWSRMFVWFGLIAVLCFGGASLFAQGTDDSAPASRSYKARHAVLRAELRGLTQIILSMRQEIAHLKRQQESEHDALKRHIKTLSSQIELLRLALREERQKRRQLQQRILQRPEGSTVGSPPTKTPPLARTSPFIPSQGPLRVRVTGQEYAKGFYMLTFVFTGLVDRIEYKLPQMADFRSTGRTHVLNPSTGRNYPQYYIMTRHLRRGPNHILVRARGIDGKLHGPFEQIVDIQSKRMSDADLFLRYQWTNPMLRQVRYRYYRGSAYFFFWASQANIMKSVRYSFGNPTLHNDLIRDGKKGALIVQRKDLEPGKYTLYARFELINGHQSPLLAYSLTLTPNGEWYNASPAAD